MKKAFTIAVLLLAGMIFVSFIGSNKTGFIKPVPEDSLAADRKKFISSILDSLKGKESTAADSVFRNLQTFTPEHRLKVTHLLAVMNYWGEALGVSCNYCHNTHDWASDDLRTKRIARDMYAMRQTINGEILKKIKDLKSNPAMVNCGTCHNGKTLPKQ